MSASAPIVLWDIDGTLLAAEEHGLDLFYEAIGDIVPGASVSSVNPHGKTDWQILGELLDASGLDRRFAPAISEKLDILSQRLVTPPHTLRLLDGAAAMLQALKARRVRNGLLTGNSPTRARHKLKGAGLDLSLIDWQACYFGGRASARSDICLEARAANPLTGLHVFGDTPNDHAAASAADIPFVAVCTGVYNRNAFADKKCRLIVDDLISGREAILGLFR
ncbi:MAG: haloacid dehalogenase-like hydrolase [Methylobacteriaceae bacterium]|jgi:phosphoglycolate phosphatase-like HAD superfamily hydrolase|nr:haloacid dehalogenase-like hydrolase [Methylobacteriaceae bacterium]